MMVPILVPSLRVWRTMDKVSKTLEMMRRNPANIRYADLKSVCFHFFGNPRQESSSHAVYKMPWQGDPRVNIQNDKGKGKPYQVKQVLRAIDRLNDGE